MWPPMRRADRIRLGGVALAALAVAGLPALAQERPESILPPGFGEPTPTPAPTPAQPAPTAGEPSQPQRSPDASPVEDAVVSSNTLSPADLALVERPVAAPAEYPSAARRDPDAAGVLPPATVGLGAAPWGSASGQWMEILLRRMDAPLASRWMHIALRNALLVQGPAPADVMPADWAAERSWLLLRLGEADAARLLVSSVDTDRFTPKMVQVAAQAALANSDPAGLCAIESKLAKVEKRIVPLVQAMCASLSGESERAAADIESARRRGSIGGIDLALADKVVGAGADTARAVTIEWEPVMRLNAWRYGLASATGMMPPDRLVDDAPANLRAWMARSPIYAPAQRLGVARTAAALGVLSSDAYVDLYGAAYDATDPDELGQSDAWRLRQAFVGKDLDARLAAMRSLWGSHKPGDAERIAALVLTARAATLVAPAKGLQADAPELIASMLAAGFDRQAARWKRVVAEMDDDPGDRSWALLALGAADASGLDLSQGRIEDFAGRDRSLGRHRTALLVAGLAGLGRIDPAIAGKLNSRYSLGLGRTTGWTRAIDGAAQRRQAGTATILAASGMQARGLDAMPALYQYHGVNALRRVGLEFTARMVAAEALARS